MGAPVVGFFSFTEVPAGHHRGYDEWHRLDHMPEQYAIDGVRHGARWAATPSCAAARSATDPLLGRAHYLTLYLMGEPLGPTLQAFRDLGGELRALDRFYEHRRSHLAAPFRIVDIAAAPRVLVRPEVVPWRPADGVYIVVEDAEHPGVALADLVAAPGVAGAWSFAPDPAVPDVGWATPDCRIAVAWLDADPVSTAAGLAPVVAPLQPRLAGPFAAVTPTTWADFDG